MILNNGNIWKNDGIERHERKKNIGNIEEKGSSQSSNKSCRMLKTKKDTPPQKKITTSDAPI